VHETILAGQILCAALAEGHRRGDPRIVRLRVGIGELESLSMEALRSALCEQARGTAAGRAELTLEVMPAALVCDHCGHSDPVPLAGDGSSCRRCGQARLRLEGRGWTVTIDCNPGSSPCVP